MARATEIRDEREQTLHAYVEDVEKALGGPLSDRESIVTFANWKAHRSVVDGVNSVCIQRDADEVEDEHIEQRRWREGG